MTIIDQTGTAISIGDDVLIHYSDGSHGEAEVTALDPGTADGHEVGITWGFDLIDNWFLPRDVEVVCPASEKTETIAAALKANA